jgi:D-sedoheptulose 7-phosphate isomerase
MKNKIKEIIAASIETKQALLEDEEMISKMAATVDMMVQAFKKGNHIYFCGNGGSASDAQHLAAELSGRFYLDRDALPAEALHCNTSYLTAVANDYSFDVIYSRLVKGITAEGDILVGLSTSAIPAILSKRLKQRARKK